MANKQKITTSVYRKIAIDLAKNIATGKYIEGEKLFGRSVLASQYNVSPETIRKSVHILKDLGILDTEKGSGVEVISANKAQEFIERYAEIENLSTIKNEIDQWAQKQIEEAHMVINKIQFVIDTAERFKDSNPITPYQIKITQDSTIIGKTADQLHFWHNTGGTIVAIRRGEDLIISPGPYATFLEEDIFYMIGNDQSYAAAKKLLFE